MRYEEVSLILLPVQRFFYSYLGAGNFIHMFHICSPKFTEFHSKFEINILSWHATTKKRLQKGLKVGVLLYSKLLCFDVSKAAFLLLTVVQRITLLRGLHFCYLQLYSELLCFEGCIFLLTVVQ